MKKCIAWCLVLLTLLPFAIGCRRRSAAVQSSESKEGQNATEVSFDDEVPRDLKFGGRNFTICCPGPDEWGIETFDCEELNSDSVNNAIYNRNQLLEERFDIRIDPFTLADSDTFCSEYSTYALSTDDCIDLLAIAYYQSVRDMIMNDYIVPWNEVPYINMEKPWWNSNINESLSILGNTFLITGDVNWSTMPQTAVCYFNKTLAAENKEIVGDLYQTVKNQEWTFNKCYTIAKQMTKDMNGDGVYDENDRFGCIQNTEVGVTGFVYAANYNTVALTDKGSQMQFTTDKMIDIIRYLYDLCCIDNISYVESFAFAYESKGIPLFCNNRALFCFDKLLFSETLRKEENNFGIIPYPKYDEGQEKYATYADQWGLACALPCTAQNYERTGAILEAMAALSRKLIRPAYYDKALVNRNGRDDESAEMLDIIFDNVIYDFGISFCTDLSCIPAKTCVETKSTDIASWYKAHENKMIINYEDLFYHVKSMYGVRK